MINIFLEIEGLKAELRARGMDESEVLELARDAETKISLALKEKLDDAMDVAIQSGVQKRSPDFINDLRPRPDAFTLETQSGNTDFSEPPYPMLDALLSNAKPMKDGSGVYKIIPVGSPTKKPRPPVHTNIFDAQKAISAERYENAVSQYNKVMPKGSKVQFRTATSKQNRSTQWVMPEQKKDFTEDLQEINSMLGSAHDEIVVNIIRTYKEGF